MKCSKCSKETGTKSYYCKPCKADYQRNERGANRIDHEYKDKKTVKQSDNYNGWF